MIFDVICSIWIGKETELSTHLSWFFMVLMGLGAFPNIYQASKQYSTCLAHGGPDLDPLLRTDPTALLWV